MLVRIGSWNIISSQFTAQEKESLNNARTGEAICPRGIIIDEKKLDKALLSKLNTALKKSARAGV